MKKEKFFRLYSISLIEDRKDNFFLRKLGPLEMKSFSLKLQNQKIEELSNLKEIQKTEEIFLKGWNYFFSGDFNKAIVLFSDSITLSPSNQESYLLRGNAYMHLGRFTEAIEDYSQIVRLNNLHEIAYKKRAQAKDCLGEFKEALKDYETDLSINQNDTWVFKRMADINFLLSFNLSALQYLEKSIIMEPFDANSYVLKGILEAEMGNYEKSIININKGISLEPDNKIYQEILMEII